MLPPSADIFIPARAGSSRFPNKPLASLAGRTVLARTLAIAQAACPNARVTVLSEAEPILAHARALGAQAMHIDAACRNGTERVAHAVAALPDAAEVVVNLQGDAVLVPPWVVGAAIEAAQREHECVAVTPIVPLHQAGFDDYRARKAHGRASGTLAVAALDDTALCFTKGVLPHHRVPPTGGVWAWRHVGLYAMRKAAVAEYLTLSPTPLEQMESLEQMRWLEHRRPVRLVRSDLRGRTLWSIDHPEDLAVATDIIDREGELC